MTSVLFTQHVHKWASVLLVINILAHMKWILIVVAVNVVACEWDYLLRRWMQSKICDVRVAKCFTCKRISSVGGRFFRKSVHRTASWSAQPMGPAPHCRCRYTRDCIWKKTKESKWIYDCSVQINPIIPDPSLEELCQVAFIVQWIFQRWRWFCCFSS